MALVADRWLYVPECGGVQIQGVTDRQSVVITDRGEPAYVLLSIDEYRRMGERGASLVERLSMDDDLDIEFEPARLDLRVPEL